MYECIHIVDNITYIIYYILYYILYPIGYNISYTNIMYPKPWANTSYQGKQMILIS